MASIDRGATNNLFPAEEKRSPAGGKLIQPSSAYGTYGDPSTITLSQPVHAHDHGTSQAYNQGIQTGIPVKFTFFKMRGWYSVGSDFETWTSVNTPNLTPPTGHSLTGIAVVGVLHQ